MMVFSTFILWFEKASNLPITRMSGGMEAGVLTPTIVSSTRPRSRRACPPLPATVVPRPPVERVVAATFVIRPSVERVVAATFVARPLLERVVARTSGVALRCTTSTSASPTSSSDESTGSRPS